MDLSMINLSKNWARRKFQNFNQSFNFGPTNDAVVVIETRESDVKPEAIDEWDWIKCYPHTKAGWYYEGENFISAAQHHCLETGDLSRPLDPSLKTMKIFYFSFTNRKYYTEIQLDINNVNLGDLKTIIASLPNSKSVLKSIGCTTTITNDMYENTPPAIDTQGYSSAAKEKDDLRWRLLSAARMKEVQGFNEPKIPVAVSDLTLLNNFNCNTHTIVALLSDVQFDKPDPSWYKILSSFLN
jgi:hypothetical protein